jgi:hypothetical protein
MPVAQLAGVHFPFGMRAGNVQRAITLDGAVNHITAEGNKVFTHAERVSGIVRNLPASGEGLPFLMTIQADFGAVIEQPVAALHAVERCGFAVAHLAKSACHAAQDVLLRNRADPVFHKKISLRALLPSTGTLVIISVR